MSPFLSGCLSLVLILSPSFSSFLEQSPHPSHVDFFFIFTPQADPSRHGADLGLQLRGRQRGGQGAAVLLRGHRLPGPPALSPPCSPADPTPPKGLVLTFPSVRVKFLLKRFSVLPFTWKNHRWTRSRNGLWLCLGGVILNPLGFSHLPEAPSRKELFLLSSSFPPNVRHKPPFFSSSKHFPSIPSSPSWD